jgi:Bacterial Ig-like domain
MKRQFPRIERRTLLGLVAALTTLGVACGPNNNVKPGAPVLTEVVVVDNGTPYKIKPDAQVCSAEAGVMEGAACSPATDKPCQQPSAGAGTDAAASNGTNWCRCRDLSACPEFAPSPATATWNCGRFGTQTPVIAVFDRLLDTTPFGPGDAAFISNVATVSPGAETVDAIYSPNGAPEYDDAGNYKTLIQPIYEHCVFGTYNGDGPSLSMAADPQLPAGATVTIKLNPDKVRAKDGTTPFASSGLLQDGMLTFQTVAFDASVAVPQPAAVDGGADAGLPTTTVPPDATPATITFTAPVDPAAIGAHITATSNGVPLTVSTATADGGMTPGDITVVAAGPKVTITPTTTWPASATIVVSVDQTAADLLGDTLPAAVSASFTTAAK